MEKSENMPVVSERVREFYERYPYPARKNSSKKQLLKYLAWIQKAFGKTKKNFFFGKRILDVGCGTGEFAVALAIVGASVKGIDLSNASIKRARTLAKKFNLLVEFEQSNLFDFEAKEKFDIVFSLGVLHHTHDAKAAFEKCVGFCRPKGLVCIGLYNKFGRLRHRLKRIVLRLLAGKGTVARMALAKKLFFEKRMLFDEAWFADKFGQSFETYHSAGEALQWFKENNLVFVGARPELKGNVFLQQLKWLFGKRGAFFVLVAKKQ